MSSTSSLSSHAPHQVGIDPRGPRFSAAITSVVLLLALLLPTPAAVVLTLAQAAFFAVGVGRGVQHTPTAWAFRTFVRPRLAAPSELEEPMPPRFAQGVGLVFTLVALALFAMGVTTLAQVALGLALVAALLNAVFNFCLGCELYLLVRRASAH